MSSFLRALNLVLPTTFVFPDKAPYENERSAVEILLRALKAHAQKAHVVTETGAADLKLVAAATAATQDKFSDARARVREAKTLCENGKGFADNFATYIEKRAKARAILLSLKGVLDDKVWKEKEAILTTADSKAAAPTRNYVGANGDVDGLATTYRNALTKAFVTDRKLEIQALKSKIAGKPGCLTLLADDIKQIDTLQGAVESAINSSQWNQAIMTGRAKVGDVLSIATKLADRRIAYDAQRVITDGKIKALGSHKSLLGQMFSMNKLVERADGLASRKAVRFEDGIAELKQIDTTCAELLQVATDAEAYTTERLAAEEQNTRLRTEKAAVLPLLKSQIQAIDSLLLAAKKMTGNIDVKPGIVNMGDAGTQDWGGARKIVAQAVAEITAASALADGLKDTSDAQALANGADSPEKVTAAVLELRKQATTAKSQPHADQANHEFTHVFASLDEATDQAAEGQLQIAAIPLKGAAELLITAKTVQAEYARFLLAFGPIDLRQKALAILTVPPAAQIQGKIDAVSAALTEATNQAKARAWGKATAALTKADAAATEAELIARLRKEFNVRAGKLELLRAPLTNPLKGKVGEMMTKATGQADAFNLDYANRFLDNAEAQIEGATVLSLANSNPNDPKFLAAVRKMLSAKGGQELLDKPTDNPNQPRNVDPTAPPKVRIPSGPELLDEIVRNLPDTVAPEVIGMLAKERFGIDLKISTLYKDTSGKLSEEVKDDQTGSVNFTADPHQRIRSGKKIFEMLAKVPEQAGNNPSMKKVERRDAYKVHPTTGQPILSPASGGFYQSKGDLVVMSGRPGDIQQKFGSKQKNASGEDQLPTPEKGYEPANENDVDYFDFATVHEVGHAVDDRMGFMSSREGQAAFGGWKTYGGAIEPIAEAVGKAKGYYTTSEQKKYVAGLILGDDPTPPTPPEGEEVAWNAALQKVKDWHAIATNGKVWWSQGDSGKITIDGVIYHEAYAKTWVSYLAAARSKGMTGYQFRAPGEWFAELYACYHCEKLGKGHPARKWLSSLSL